jgi:hypothetical protein
MLAYDIRIRFGYSCKIMSFDFSICFIFAYFKSKQNLGRGSLTMIALQTNVKIV